MRRSPTDVVTAFHQSESDATVRRDAGDRADGCTRGIVDRIAHSRVVDVDDPQRARGVGTTAVHAFDEFLARVATLREAHRQRHDSGDDGDRRAGNDLGAHPRPSGSDPCRLMSGRGFRVRGVLDGDVGLHADLEAVESGDQGVAETGVDVEVEPVVAHTCHTGERLDFSGRIEHQRPRPLTDPEGTNVLRDLRLEVYECVGALDDHMVAGILVDCGNVGCHSPSLAWHTAIVMSDDDIPSDRRLDDLARRAVDSLLVLVQRGTRLAAGTLIIVIVICLGGFALGIAALSNGMQTVWIIVGGFGAALAIGAVVVAMFRLWAVTRLSTLLVAEVKTLVAEDPRSERVVIDTVEASDGVQDRSAVVMSRQFFSMNDAVGRAGQFTALGVALRSVTMFPLLMLLASLITVGFLCLSLLFLLGLAL